MKGTLALQNEAMIDALRMCLGYEPLYRKRTEHALWDSMPFDDGARRINARKPSDNRAGKEIQP